MWRSFLLTLLLLTVWTSASAQELSGTASYRERIALPPEATFRAILFDISNNDQVEIGRFEAPGDAGPPYQFVIEYDERAVVDNGIYAIQTEVIWPDRAYVAAGTILAGFPENQNPVINLVMVRPGISTLQNSLGTPAQTAPEAVIGAHGLALPALFSGNVTTEGQSQSWRLLMNNDQSFQLSREFETNDVLTARRDSVGQWYADPTLNVLFLSDGAEMPLMVKPTNAGDLTFIDSNTNEAFDGQLVRSAAVTLDLSEMKLTGMMTYFADAAVMTECLSGLTAPISMEGDYLALERAYLENRSGPEKPLLVEFVGGLALREGMEGPNRPKFIVDNFQRTRPEADCDQPLRDAALTNTYWRIEEIKGTPFPAGASRQEPHLILEVGEHQQYRATLGCNRMRGGYFQQDDGVSFSPAASTMMACAAPLDELEQQFNEALAQVSRYTLSGDLLVLQDDQDVPLVALYAVYY